MKTVYSFHPVSREYMGSVQLTESDESPLEPGVYLIPAGCVEVPPPTHGAGEYLEFSGDAWSVKTIPVPEQKATSEPLVPSPPTPLEQIRALEAQYADAQAKLTRQSLLVLALDKACADPLANGMTREQVHAALLATSNGYAALWSLEQQVEALRSQL